MFDNYNAEQDTAEQERQRQKDEFNNQKIGLLEWFEPKAPWLIGAEIIGLTVDALNSDITGFELRLKNGQNAILQFSGQIFIPTNFYVEGRLIGDFPKELASEYGINIMSGYMGFKLEQIK